MGVALLAGVGATIANVRWPLAGATWSEPPHLWAGLVGMPSTGKSPAMQAVFDLIRHAEDRLATGYDDERRDFEARKSAAKAHREAWEVVVKQAVKETKATPPMPSAAEEPEPPIRPRIRVADVTTEKLGALASALPKGLLLVRDELAGWLGSFDRYGGGGSDRAFALEMYGGRSYRIDRMKNAEPINIRHLSIGVLGSIQPDKLSTITAGADDGLSSRILWCWPEKAPAFHLTRETFDNGPASNAFARLVDLEMATDTYGNPEPRILRLEPEAEDAIETFAREMNAEMDDAAGIMAGAIGKTRGQVLRLSCILTFLHWCGQPGRPEPKAISYEAVVSAAGLVASYFLQMAERVFGDSAIPAPERHARVIALRLRQERAATFNARDLGRRTIHELRSPEAMDAACKVLMADNLIRPAHRKGGGGRPAKDYEVHPAVSGRA